MDQATPPNNVNVVAAVANYWGSGHSRIIYPITAANAAIAVKDKLDVRFEGRTVVDIDFHADVVVMQQTMLWWEPQFIRLAQERGMKIVIDIDDDTSCIDPANPAFAALDPHKNPNQNWFFLKVCTKLADLVTVSSDELATRYTNGRRPTALLHNLVPEFWTEIPHKDSNTVGWSGNVREHPNDLQTTLGGVGEAVRAARVRFYHVGRDTDKVKRLLRLSRATGPGLVDIHEYPRHLSNIGIGIVPLADTRFNGAKSWLKGVEYAALGIPFVASDVPEYRKLKEQYDLGILASDRAEDWRRALSKLIGNADLRKELGQQYRETVRKHLTYELHAEKWIDTWMSVAG